MNTKPSRSSYKLYLVASKILVLVVIGFLLYDKLKSEENLIDNLLISTKTVISEKYLPILLVIVLMPVNWLLEALKWKILVNKFTQITLVDSLKGVLAGLSLSFATPHGIGDYFGRILSIQETGREQLVGSLFISRSTQMLATALFGLIGLEYLYGFWWPFAALLIIAFVLASIFTLLNVLTKYQWFNKYFGVLKSYNASILIQVQGLAILRYLVFSFQFLIIILLFLPSISVDVAFSGSTYIFLAKSILPSFNFLSDLGIREYSAIYFFERYNFELVSIVNASLLLWVINILIPTLVGIPSMLKLKWFLSSK